jgi:hypothetical protein
MFSKFETNNSQLIEFSPIKESKEKIIIPNRFYEIYFIDFFEENNFQIIDEEDNIILKTKDKFILDSNKKETKITLEHLYYKMVAEFFSNIWYPEIKDLTFKSIFIDLTEEDINRILNFKSSKDAEYKELILKINEGIKQFNGKAFIRLNSVSPKISEYMTSGEQIIEVFNNSSRIHSALQESKKFGIDSKIMLREFQENLPVEYEFRCFIYNSHITAISQYNQGFIKEFQSKEYQQFIVERITTFYKSIKDRFPYVDCTMDIVFLNQDEIKIIEFNGFGIEQNVGGCLYNWFQDFYILYNDQGKTDIRVYENEFSHFY